MKMKKLPLILAILGISLLWTSCDDDKKERIYDLRFEKESYVIVHNKSAVTINVASGNKTYEVEVDDESILTATGFNTLSLKSAASGAYGFGSITIRPLAVGKTSIRVADLVTGQQKTLEITILPPYLSLHALGGEPRVSFEEEDKNAEGVIQTDMLANTPLQPDFTFLLLKEKPILYVLSEDKIVAKGSYAFESTGSGRYMCFFLPTGEEVEESRFCMVMGDGGAHAINAYFGLNWDLSAGLKDTRMNLSPPPATLFVIEDFTERYQADYPKLTSARIRSELLYGAPALLFSSLPDPLIEELLRVGE